MPARNFKTFIWRDEESKVAFVGYGEGIQPWHRVWAMRSAHDSELNRWLNSLPKMPPLFMHSDSAMYATEAKALVFDSQKALRDEGFKILSRRPKHTFGGGHRKRRPVEIDGKQFGSVSDAARALGISHACVSQNCTNPKKTNWKYADA